ncbi:MAG: hypothetical protein J7497_09505 [Chitinophagaceae bacterium]|nr:hypothetical protein [Chitinophagaceae bacterium]
MKRKSYLPFKTLLIGLIALISVTVSNKVQAQPGFRANVSFNDFYAELSPYGRWVSMPRYGQVWIYNEPDFRPYYTNGRWLDTDLGYSWSSGYSWGWAPFHYGRWEFDPYYGWFWIPGYDYAPAWVVWSQADDYYGWAPLGFGVDINISVGSIPYNRWMYAPVRRIGYARIDRYCVPYNKVNFYYQRQRPIVNVYVHNNVRYDRGPARVDYRNNYRNDYRNYNNGNGSRPDYRRPQNDNRQEYADNSTSAPNTGRPRYRGNRNNNLTPPAANNRVNVAPPQNRNFNNNNEMITQRRASAQNNQPQMQQNNSRVQQNREMPRVSRSESNSAPKQQNFTPHQRYQFNKAEARR